MEQSQMQELTPIQVRVLGCLMEKQETTPDQYPLTLNALCTACNQKTSRSPVTNYTLGEVGHTVRELEQLNLVREVWSARVHRYEHHAGRVLGLHSKGLALLCTLMLRGPQTLGELKAHSQRMFAFDDLDDVQYSLNGLIGHEPPYAVTLPRVPGQKEDRHAHLLSGEPEVPQGIGRAAGERERSRPATGLEARVEALESALASLRERLEALEDK